MGTDGQGRENTAFGLRWETRETPGEIRLVLTGEVDLIADGELDSISATLAHADRPVVVDLSHVNFMDSTGLRFLSRLAQHLRSNGGHGMTLGPMSDQVKRVLDVSGLTEFFANADR